MNINKRILRRFIYLLWKNILWKSRHWPTTLFEIFFPTFLFALLICLRIQFPSEKISLHNRAAKAMPSAGIIPFIQTAYCDIDNRFNNGYDGLPFYRGSRVAKLYESLSKIFSNSFDAFGDNSPFEIAFNNFLTDIRYQLSINNSEKSKESNSFLYSNYNKLCNFINYSNYEYFEQIFGSCYSQSQKPLETNDYNSSNFISSVSNLYSLLSEYLNVVQFFHSIIYDTKITLCGYNKINNDNPFLKIINSLNNDSPKYNTSAIDQNRMKREQQYFPFNSTPNNYSIDRNTSLNSSLLDYGLRIIFTPNNSLSWNIIREMNSTFHYIDIVRNLLLKISKQNNQLRSIIKSQTSVVNSNFYQNNLDGAISSFKSNDSLFKTTAQPQNSNFIDPNSLLRLWIMTNWVKGNITEILSSTPFIISWDFFRGFSSEKELTIIAIDQNERARHGISYVFAGIVFENLSDNSSTPPSQVNYFIRMYSSNVKSPEKKRSISWIPGSNDEDDVYLEYGYIFLQDLIERSIINIQLNRSVNSPGGYLQPFPYSCFLLDTLLLILQGLLPLIFIISNCLAISMISRTITHEKENKLQDILVIMGITIFEHWLSWIVIYIMILLPSNFINLIILKYSGILPYSNGLLLLLVMLSYDFSIINFGILISVFFKNANTAGSLTGLLYFLLYFLTPLVQYLEFTLSIFEMMLVLLISPAAYGLYIYYNVQWEIQYKGIQWSNIYLSPLDQDLGNPLICWLFIIFDSLVYLSIAVYLQATLPGINGVRKPWYFLIYPKFWNCIKITCIYVSDVLTKRYKFNCLHKNYKFETLREECSTTNGETWNVLAQEDYNDENVKMIEIYQLNKVYQWGIFGRRKLSAINSLSLCLFEGQITSLLGHNGSGKTSLMMILSGILSPSSGKITICGYSLPEDIDKIRCNLIGLCPQHSILYNHMTVMEHLLFYGSILGISKKNILKESYYLLDSMQLLEHSRKRVSQISGGSRRKLCVCISFLGSAKFIILDEPTAGIDPFSRKQIWEFLLSQRQGKSILLSTHHMDEAEIIGDRIAIIDHGHLLCVGSLPYLKQQFQLKYTLKFVKINGRNADNLKHLINSEISSAKIVKESRDELHFSVPISYLTKDDTLSKLFSKIENQQEYLEYSSFGFEAPNLEQLFLFLTELRYSDEIFNDVTTGEIDETTLQSNPFNVHTEFEPQRKIGINNSNKIVSHILRHIYLYLIQSYSLFLKRFQFLKRDFKSVFIQFFLFIIVIILTLWLSTISSFSESREIIFTSNIYSDISSSYYTILGSSKDNNSPSVDQFLNTMVCPGGLGVSDKYNLKEYSILPSSISNDHFSANNRSLKCYWYRLQYVTNFSMEINGSFFNKTCPCMNENIKCPKNSQIYPHQIIQTVPNLGYLEDLRNQNISDYLIKTELDFIEKRYGGASFGHERNDIPKESGEFINIDANNLNFRQNRVSLETFVVRNYSKAWFSFKGYHAMPLYLNVMNNAILRRELYNSYSFSYNLSAYGILGGSKPWPQNSQELYLSQVRSGKPFMIPMLLLFGYCFLASSFILFVLEERVSGTKHLQIISGLNKLVYWCSTYIWDLLLYTIAILLGSIIFLIFNQQSFISLAHYRIFFVASISFGMSSISMMYVFSWIFKSPGKAYVVMFCGSYVVGMIFMVIDFTYNFAHKTKYQDISNILENVFLIAPTYSITKILYNLILIFIQESIFNEMKSQLNYNISFFNENPENSLYKFNIIWKFILAMLIESILLFILNLIIDFLKQCSNSRLSLNRNANCTLNNDDQDVFEEQNRIFNKSQDNILILSKIYKRYYTLGNFFRFLFKSSSKFNYNHSKFAVNNVTFGVKKECFGLLGLNGSGKTSIFNMITGVQSITNGSIQISGFDITKSRTKTYQLMGYCAQYDLLYPLLTGREHLYFYGRLKGIGHIILKSRVNYLIKYLDLNEYADLSTDKYSGGNKRKLSTAIAIISSPNLLLLDEPTAGIDPYAKQFLWKIIKDITGQGVSTLLTTHSMSECETLCQRIGIIDHGMLLCIGSPQHLKSKFGKDYVLKFYLKHSQNNDFLIDAFKTLIPNAELKYSFHSYIEFHINVNFKLSDILAFMLTLKDKYCIIDFSIGQTTLENVFLNIIENRICMQSLPFGFELSQIRQ